MIKRLKMLKAKNVCLKEMYSEERIMGADPKGCHRGKALSPSHRLEMVKAVVSGMAS